MRFSALTLLIVLPAAAYAAVCPPQFSIQSRCGDFGDFCYNERPCCPGWECEQYKCVVGNWISKACAGTFKNWL
ncbi:hypothetical protein BGW80DRAFT_1319548 [Lactifluus volemus]|nr:hypothetical protein BGW80DRAFT_1319548 [Lactifluus volemus]